jgi:hypothetical protein
MVTVCPVFAISQLVCWRTAAWPTDIFRHVSTSTFVLLAWPRVLTVLIAIYRHVEPAATSCYLVSPIVSPACLPTYTYLPVYAMLASCLTVFAAGMWSARLFCLSEFVLHAFPAYLRVLFGPFLVPVHLPTCVACPGVTAWPWLSLCSGAFVLPAWLSCPHVRHACLLLPLYPTACVCNSSRPCVIFSLTCHPLCPAFSACPVFLSVELALATSQGQLVQFGLALFSIAKFDTI